MVENCFVPNGTLYLRYNYFHNTITLARCCLLEPFIELSLDEFLKIKNIVNYAKNFNYTDEIKFWPGAEDRCKTCNFSKNKIAQVSVGLSYACNLNCHHCFYEGHHKDNSQLKDLYFNTLYNIKNNNLESIQLTDVGEPFFYFYKTLDYLKSLTLNDTKNINFLTNANILNIERIKMLKDISESTGITYTFIISIDGCTKESYEKARINGSFERVIENARYLNDLFDVGINFTIRSPNMSDVLNIKPFFKNLGFKRVDIQYDIYDEECKNLYYKYEDILKSQKLI